MVLKIYKKKKLKLTFNFFGAEGVTFAFDLFYPAVFIPVGIIFPFLEFVNMLSTLMRGISSSDPLSFTASHFYYFA